MDLVIPYVNTADEKWINEIKSYRKDHKDVRFRDYGFLKYVFRSVEKYANWIDRIFLILAYPSQIPEWLDVSNPKLKIVYHKDYIPEKFLPTFNSCTIECFIPLIKDLSNEYIIGNDDIFFINPTSKEDFFKEEKPYFNWEYRDIPFRDLFFDKLSIHNLRISSEKSKRINLQHTFLPHNKSYQLELLKKLNLSYITRFRETYSSGTQYMYSYNYIVNNLCELNPNKFEYSNVLTNSEKLEVLMFRSDQKAMCLNDANNLTELNLFGLIVVYLNLLLENKFPNKSSFEKNIEIVHPNFKLTHSVWTKPYVSKQKFYMDLICAAVSVSFAHKNGWIIDLHTDSRGFEYYKLLPYDNIYKTLDTIPENITPDHFEYGKYWVLSQVTEDTLNIDTDLFISSYCPNADLIFDRTECAENGDGLGCYTKDPNFKKFAWENRVENCGCVGGKLYLLKDLCQQYFDHWNEAQPIISEQQNITSFKCDSIGYLNPSGNRWIGASKIYWHALGKWKYEFFPIIMNILELLDTDLYNKLKWIELQ